MNTPEQHLPCPSCACFVKQSESVCPHCGADCALSRGSALPSLSPAAAALMVGLAATGCIGTGDGGDAVALYGVPDTGYVDNDGDGYSVRDGDCDDDDDAIHPEAEETAGDGIDSNCNDEDDT
jgi:hypothetical protein